MNKTYAILATKIEKSYGKQLILKGVDLAVERGTIFALLGPNGAGKTTMVRILGTLLGPDKGTAIINGHDVIHNVKEVRSIISLTGQYAAVDELLTGEENLVMIGKLCGLRRAEARSRAQELLTKFDLVSSKQKLAKTYSGGMRRKLDLAMSLVASPEIIFLDEPTTGLDPRSRKQMWEIITALSTAGTTIFLTTQYLEEADELADMIAVLDNGKIVAKGTPAHLKQQIGGRYVEVNFKKAEELDRAKQLFHPKDVVEIRDTLSLRVTTDGSFEGIRTTLDILHTKHVIPAAIALKEPTLDDVFFTLTGITTSEEQNQ